MPKGGDLHYHFSGGVYPEDMLHLAKKKQYCLNKNTLAIIPFSSDCTLPLSTPLKPQNFWYAKILKAWSMKNFEPSKESRHDHFFASFFKFNTLFFDNRAKYLAQIMTRAAAQHEHYLELMFAPKNVPSGRLVMRPLSEDAFEKRYLELMQNDSFQRKVQATVNDIANVKQKARRRLGCNKADHKPVCQLEVKFIFHALREQKLQFVFAQVMQGFLTATKSNEIVGVNLVQPEDGKISMQDYQKHMAIFRFFHKKFPQVHIALHAGELENNTGITHIHDAIFKGKAERIGHGVAINSEPNPAALLNYMATNAVPVEINLTSNEQLLDIDMKHHPFMQYLRYQVPLVLSTDDEGILRTSLTKEYQKAVEVFKLDYKTLKQLNRNAITYSFIAGKSLWSDRKIAKPINDCADLNSKSCLNFIAHSPKGKLQRDLELDLLAFENRIFAHPQ